MWQKKESKLQLAASMVRQVMPEFSQKKNVIILCDSWYMKKSLVSVVDEYPNLNLIGNHYTGVRRVLTNLFGVREVLAYVTSTVKEGGAKRLFFSTVSPEQLDIFCAWQEKVPLNQIGSDWMQYIPLFLYSFRWNIEVSYYEQKTFWSLCSYMVRSCKGIEMMVNLINISYCAMKLLPYVDKEFADYKDKSVQEIHFAISEGIREQIFCREATQSVLPCMVINIRI